MSAGMRNLSEQKDLDELKRAEAAIIYKHSPICPVSWRAEREVQTFVEKNADMPVYVVNVVEDRAFSRQLAEDLGVRHESPQAILMQSGDANKHVSHGQITAQLLEEWTSQADS